MTGRALASRLGAASFGVFALAGLADAPARAADYFAGKTISIVVGNPPGGGYDAYARLLGRHMGKHIPGKPNFITRNMPGAASIIAARFIANTAPKDGTAFGLIFPGALMEPLTGDPAKYKYDPQKFAFLGTMDSGTRLCVVRGESKIKTMADVQKNKVVVAATAPGSSTTDYAWFFNNLSGAKFTVTTGYKGPGAVMLAVERGEAEGICSLDSNTIETMRPGWLASGKLRAIVQAGLETRADLAKLGAAPMWDFLPADKRAVGELFVSQQVFARPFIAPPGINAQALAILRKAFMDTMKDKELLAEAEKSKLAINGKSGEDVAALVKKVYASPPALVEALKQALKP
ncbi:MAG: Bug family tripartite tricarboxylate transporter substrate binding protein [Beijerinckiaceae bacterium]